MTNIDFLNNKEIGARIQFRRNELNLTLQDIANSVGVAKSTIQRYEAGKINKIKLPVIEAIARALNTNPEWLVIRNAPKEIIDEQEHLFKFRALSHNAKLSVSNILNYANKLNDEAVQKIENYASDLNASGKYKKHYQSDNMEKEA